MTRDSDSPRPEGSSARSKVLVVDDDPRLLESLIRSLDNAEFAVEASDTGEDGLEKALLNSYHVIVLDAVLPGIQALDVARRLREEGRTTPILILTGRNSTDFLVEALEAGADDFLGKPFEAKELTARVHALDRRGKIVPRMEFGEFVIDPLQRTLKIRDTTVHLTGIELRILLNLASAGGEFVSHSELLSSAWEIDFDPGTNLVYTHMTNLRKKLNGLGLGAVLASAPGRGYLLVKG